jgi:hypothetical protein
MNIDCGIHCVEGFLQVELQRINNHGEITGVVYLSDKDFLTIFNHLYNGDSLYYLKDGEYIPMFDQL